MAGFCFYVCVDVSACACIVPFKIVYEGLERLGWRKFAGLRVVHLDTPYGLLLAGNHQHLPAVGIWMWSQATSCIESLGRSTIAVIDVWFLVSFGSCLSVFFQRLSTTNSFHMGIIRGDSTSSLLRGSLFSSLGLKIMRVEPTILYRMLHNNEWPYFCCLQELCRFINYVTTVKFSAWLSWNLCWSYD